MNSLGMANSPTLVPVSSKGTKCDRDMRVKSGMCSAKHLRVSVLLLLLVLPLLCITAVGSSEVNFGDTYQLMSVVLY